MSRYCQQIGRAGRDGLPADCKLIFSDTEFAAYGSDFYTKGLSGEALASQQVDSCCLSSTALIYISLIFECVCSVEVVVNSHQPKHFGDLLLHLRVVAAEKS